jgi:nitrogen-specific signal transduction histidine kinase
MTDVLAITKYLVPRKVALIDDVPERLPCIIGDADRLVQIMYNLIGNAGEVVG